MIDFGSATGRTIYSSVSPVLKGFITSGMYNFFYLYFFFLFAEPLSKSLAAYLATLELSSLSFEVSKYA